MCPRRGKFAVCSPHRYNAAMTSQAKEQRSGKRRRGELRSTEHRNPDSKNLDRMTAVQIVRVMNGEGQKVAAAVGRGVPAIARAVDAIVGGIRKGGPLI